MTATQRYKQAVSRSVGPTPAGMKITKTFSWEDWKRTQTKNPIQFVKHNKHNKPNEKTVAMD